MKRIKFKKSLGFALAAVMPVILMATSTFAWGPERETFTMENPATYPTFNSITNNPTIGDERNFVRIGKIDAEVTDLKDEVEIVPGQQYLVYIYFHNDASETYNYSQYNHSGIALGTRMSSSFPTYLSAGERGTVTGAIMADNSKPAKVWDEAYVTTASEKVVLNYVSGSAKIYNDWATNNSILSTDLFTEAGTLIGLTALDGGIPGCEQYHGVVSYVLQASLLDGTVEKTVSTDGVNFSETVEAKEGDEIYFKLAVKNTGDVALTNASIEDALPEKLNLVSGSVELWVNESTTKDKQSDALVANGLNLGTIGTGNAVYITYRAKVAEGLDCGSLKLTNTAKLTYDSNVSTGDSDTDTATVKVSKDGCDTVPEDDPEDNPEEKPEDKPDEEELPDEIVKTGPLEITLATIIVLGIGGGGFYFYKTRKTLKTVTEAVGGGIEPKVKTPKTPKKK
ncbi:MAG: hypothetical protein Q4B34_02085 [Candidatus Saccharibacteria bacterium]|nr:hypothetical protein [Candidatus Saccharibacteria bacterium]